MGTQNVRLKFTSAFQVRLQFNSIKIGTQEMVWIDPKAFA